MTEFGPTTTAPDVRRPITEPPAPAPGRRRRVRSLVLRILAICTVVGLTLAAAGVGAALWFQHRYNANIDRFADPFSALPAEGRPGAAPDGAVNILLLGSDSRIADAGDPADWQVGAQRTDAIMIAHIAGDRKSVTITSIPRDSWVNVPGHGMNKINAGFSFGGPSLAVRTVENYTHVRIDHVMIMDFGGFKNVTDALGGVDITVPEATDGLAGQHFTAGTHHMNGTTALAYVRERHGLPGGDLDREKRQQNWIRAILAQEPGQGVAKDVFTLNGVLSSLTRSLAVDDSFSLGSMRSLALSLRSVPAGQVTFLTAPVASTGREGGQDVVHLDPAANQALWRAVAGDRTGAWLSSHPHAALGGTVR